MNNSDVFNNPSLIRTGSKNKFIFPEYRKGTEYEPSEALKQAVIVALKLQKPLLLTGAPGTGKSELAHYLAWHFDLGKVLFFATRTDSAAIDLLYRYDSMAHFHKVNIEKTKELNAAEIQDNYIRYLALGEAICNSGGEFHNKVQGDEEHRRRVVLIDEIDKAPRDLPNDILTIIEDMRFEVPELKTAKNTNNDYWEKTGKPEYKPIVILTSNSEKTLPEAFLRRCVFFHIKNPDNKQLRNILKKKKSLFPDYSEESFKPLVDLFEKMSKDVKKQKPSTHELILWAWWMRDNGFDADSIYQFEDLPEEKQEVLLSGISILTKDSDDWENVRSNIRHAVYSK